VPDRAETNAILFVVRTGCTWNSLNATGICHSSSAHRRFEEWTAAGVFEELWRQGLVVYDEHVGIGDELPEQLATGEARAKWLAEAKRRLEQQRAEEARPIPASRVQRLRESKRRLEEELATECRASEAYEAYRARGDAQRAAPGLALTSQALRAGGDAAEQDQHDRPRLAQRQDAARMGAGYNAQAATNERQIMIAAELTSGAGASTRQSQPGRAPLRLLASGEMSTWIPSLASACIGDDDLRGAFSDAGCAQLAAGRVDHRVNLSEVG
jgi:hypothetical protein